MWCVFAIAQILCLLLLSYFQPCAPFQSNYLKMSPPRVLQRDQLFQASSTAPKEVNLKLPLPFMQMKKIGLSGSWQQMHNNYVLLPPNDMQPIGVIHFLGGAFFGAAPNILYGSFLELFAKKGYIVVATPFLMNMDYVKICDEILGKFDPLAEELAKKYGALPVIGIGHSLGAVLQTLITSLFPDTPRAVNILIAFNCKPSTTSIPLLQEVILPLAQRNRISEESINNSGFVKPFRDLLYTYSKSPFSPLFVQEEIVPLFEQTTTLVDQIPPLLSQLANGTTNFSPKVEDTKEACRRMYRARKTLLLKFTEDTLDESLSIVGTLKEANTIMRMKRPLIDMQVDLLEIPGNHLTPLIPMFPGVDLGELSFPRIRIFQELSNMKNLVSNIMKYLEV